MYVAVCGGELVVVCRKESCKKAFTEAQGLVLFGSKLKLSPVERDGEIMGGLGAVGSA